MTLLEKFEQVLNWVHDLFAKIPQHIKDFAEIAIGITTKIEAALKSGTAIIITELVPGDMDNELRKEAIAFLEEFLLILKAISAIPSEFDIAAEDVLQAELQKMASKLVAIQDYKELPQNRYDLYTQAVFSKQKSA